MAYVWLTLWVILWIMYGGFYGLFIASFIAYYEWYFSLQACAISLSPTVALVCLSHH
jgi:hypothetical protein